jgi:putative oxidoreductase
MDRLLGGLAPYFYGLMRIVVGLLFACHGAQKLFGVLGGIGGQPGLSVPLVSLMGLAGIIEFCGGLLIATGVLTSYAAFIASGEMAVAYFTQHSPGVFWPILNNGELAVLYCFVFLYIAAQGAGALSLERLVQRRPPTPMEKAERRSSNLSS